MHRRRFLSRLATMAAAAPLARAAESARAAAPAEGDGLIDTNVYLSHWVVRRSSVESPAKLVEKLQRHGVTSAWTGSFDGVLHSDIAGANARLAETCAREGRGVLRPFGTINPTLPDWEEDVRRCHEVHQMSGVRLFPNYHGYTLDDARFARLLEMTASRRLLLQIALSIEDDRSQNPALTAAPVTAAPLPELLAKIPHARVMLLNSGSRVVGANYALLKQLTTAGVLLEIAALEGVAGIESVLKNVPAARFAFGSHTPYFYFESALLKLQESALTREQLAAIRFGNAQTALSVGRASARLPFANTTRAKTG